MNDPIQTMTKSMRAALKAGDATTYAIAKGAKVPEPTVHRFLYNDRQPTARVLDRLLGYLGWTLTVTKRKGTKR